MRHPQHTHPPNHQTISHTHPPTYPQVPLDGQIVHGRAMVSSEHITGEALPVLRRGGDEVAAGSLNRDGLLVLRALRPAEDSTPARIARLTLDAQVRWGWGSGLGRGMRCAASCAAEPCCSALHSRPINADLLAPTPPPPLPLAPRRPSARSCAPGWTSLGSCTARE